MHSKGCYHQSNSDHVTACQNGFIPPFLACIEMHQISFQHYKVSYVNTYMAICEFLPLPKIVPNNSCCWARLSIDLVHTRAFVYIHFKQIWLFFLLRLATKIVRSMRILSLVHLEYIEIPWKYHSWNLLNQKISPADVCYFCEYEGQRLGYDHVKQNKKIVAKNSMEIMTQASGKILMFMWSTKAKENKDHCHAK